MTATDLLADAERRMARAHRCPACGVESWYVPDADRYTHADGSDMRPCWRRWTIRRVR